MAAAQIRVTAAPPAVKLPAASARFARGGRIELVIGPMFSGKSTELLRRIRRYRFARKECLYVMWLGWGRGSPAAADRQRLVDGIAACAQADQVRQRHSVQRGEPTPGTGLGGAASHTSHHLSRLFGLAVWGLPWFPGLRVDARSGDAQGRVVRSTGSGHGTGGGPQRGRRGRGPVLSRRRCYPVWCFGAHRVACTRARAADSRGA